MPAPQGRSLHLLPEVLFGFAAVKPQHVGGAFLELDGNYAPGFAHRTYPGWPNQNSLQILLWWNMDMNYTGFSTAPVTVGAEFCTLPAKGGDPVCGMSRRWWYDVEKAGLIKLVRVRMPGRQLGRVLLPIPQALACIRRLGEAAERARK